MMKRRDSGADNGNERAAGLVPTGAHNPTQAFFLARMERLLRLVDEYATLLKAEDWETRLLQKAIYSSYCDCVQLGVGAQARELLARHRSELG
ncbi:MAG: hypothetical protein ACYC4L_09720 [Chloroflexota bacterium]